MNLVVGATGILGSEICRQLRARGMPVRALVRAGSPGESALRALGAEIVTGDLRSRASLEAACRDVRAVFSTATAMGSKDKSLKMRDVDRDGQLALVEIAAASGVEQFIYVSATPVLTEKAPLIRYKREVERALRASGMQWTILQPSVFMEVWLSPLLGFDAAAAKAVVFGPGTAPMSWIAVADVAAHAVRALDDPRLANHDLPLGGPAGIAPNDVVGIFERVGGRKFSVRHVPAALLSLMSPVVALFNEGAASGMSMGAQTSHGDVIDTPLQREVALPLTTVEEYARRVVQR
jgi:NADH dehydrogenase